MIKLVSFNVNGLNSFNKYVCEFYNCSLNDYIKNELRADILCVQETKGSKKSLEKFLILDDYKVYMSYNKIKNGVSGVCFFVSKKLYLKNCVTRIDLLKEYCDEGRIIIADFGNFKVANVYFPYFDPDALKNNNFDSEKNYKVNRFYDLMGEYIANNPDVIICGDINAVYSVKDHYQFYSEYERIKGLKDNNYEDEFFKYEPHKTRLLKFSSSQTELPFYFRNELSLNEFLFEKYSRKWLYELILKKTHVDSFRHFYPNLEKKYTAWNTIYRLREKNMGSRIDYILVPRSLISSLTGAEIHDKILGSDHCPVSIDLDLPILNSGDNILTRKHGLFSFMKK